MSEYADPLILAINRIVNDHTSWKVKRALLRQLKLDEKSIEELVPKPKDGEDL